MPTRLEFHLQIICRTGSGWAPIASPSFDLDSALWPFRSLDRKRIFGPAGAYVISWGAFSIRQQGFGTLPVRTEKIVAVLKKAQH